MDKRCRKFNEWMKGYDYNLAADLSESRDNDKKRKQKSKNRAGRSIFAKFPNRSCPA